MDIPQTAQLIDVSELAKRLSVSKRTIWRLDARGAIPSPLRLGKTVRWRDQDIEDWIAAGCPNRRGESAS